MLLEVCGHEDWVPVPADPVYDVYWNRSLAADPWHEFNITGAFTPSVATNCTPMLYRLCNDSDCTVLLHETNTTNYTLIQNLPTLRFHYGWSAAPYWIYLQVESFNNSVYSHPIRVEVCGHESWSPNATYSVYTNWHNRSDNAWVDYNLLQAFSPVVRDDNNTYCFPADYRLCLSATCTDDTPDDWISAPDTTNLKYHLIASNYTLRLSHHVAAAKYSIYLVAVDYDRDHYAHPIEIEVCGHEAWSGNMANPEYTIFRNRSDTYVDRYDLLSSSRPVLKLVPTDRVAQLDTTNPPANVTTTCMPEKYLLCDDADCASIRPEDDPLYRIVGNEVFFSASVARAPFNLWIAA